MFSKMTSHTIWIFHIVQSHYIIHINFLKIIKKTLIDKLVHFARLELKKKATQPNMGITIYSKFFDTVQQKKAVIERVKKVLWILTIAKKISASKWCKCIYDKAIPSFFCSVTINFRKTFYPPDVVIVLQFLAQTYQPAVIRHVSRNRLSELSSWLSKRQKT